MAQRIPDDDVPSGTCLQAALININSENVRSSMYTDTQKFSVCAAVLYHETATDIIALPNTCSFYGRIASLMLTGVVGNYLDFTSLCKRTSANHPVSP